MNRALKLKIFYDGQCPLCRGEIDSLKKRDSQGAIDFIDIEAADFEHRYPSMDKQQLHAILHGQTAEGEFIYGLDVSHVAWRAVARHHIVTYLFDLSRLPLIKPVADAVYRVFARHRQRIGHLFGSKKTCDSERCARD